MARAKRAYEGTDAYEAGVQDAEKRLRETSEWVWDNDAIDWGIDFEPILSEKDKAQPTLKEVFH